MLWGWRGYQRENVIQIKYLEVLMWEEIKEVVIKVREKLGGDGLFQLRENCVWEEKSFV